MSIACRTEGSGNKSPNMFKLDFSCSQCNYLLKSLVRLAIVILMQPTANWSGGQIFGERRHWALDGTSGCTGLRSPWSAWAFPFHRIQNRPSPLSNQFLWKEMRRWRDRHQHSTASCSSWTASRWSCVPRASCELAPMSLAWKRSSEPHSLALGRHTAKKNIFGTSGTKNWTTPSRSAKIKEIKQSNHI